MPSPLTRTHFLRPAWLFCFGTLLTAAASAHTPPESETTPAAPSEDRAPALTEVEAEEYHFEEDVDCPYCANGEVPKQRRGLHWHDHWNRVGTWEYVTIGVSTATAVGTFLLVDPSRSPSWNRPILLDRAARDLLVFESAEHRRTAKAVSDGLVAIAVVQPVLIDNLAVAWWAHGADDVALQMFVINAQSYSLTLAINGLTKRLTNRVRPRAEACTTGEREEGCDDPGRYRSFYSGHSALTATGAGLVCAHHTQLMLYGNALLDTAACVAAVLGTAATGALRVASDNHWTSDVMVGHLAGYLSGYLLPTLLYYREFSFTPHEHGPDFEMPSVAVLPLIDGDAIGLSAAGVF